MYKHTNKQTRLMMLQSRKTTVYCSFRFAATKRNTNMLEPLETKPESASNPLQHKQPPDTHIYHCSALFSLKTGSCERTGLFVCVCFYQCMCRYSIYPHSHACKCMLVRSAGNLIRSTAGLWFCHIYIQMEI